jgi:hypothetical protein
MMRVEKVNGQGGDFAGQPVRVRLQGVNNSPLERRKVRLRGL